MIAKQLNSSSETFMR